MANLVVHFEIHASEPQRLIDFYSELFGWRFTQFGDMPYWSIDTGEGAIGNVAGQAGRGINGGLTQRKGPRPKSAPRSTDATSSWASTTSTSSCAAASNSAAPRRCPADGLPGVGRVGYLLDPDHNVFGLSRR